MKRLLLRGPRLSRHRHLSLWMLAGCVVMGGCAPKGNKVLDRMIWRFLYTCTTPDVLQVQAGEPARKATLADLTIGIPANWTLGPVGKPREDGEIRCRITVEKDGRQLAGGFSYTPEESWVESPSEVLLDRLGVYLWDPRAFLASYEADLEFFWDVHCAVPADRKKVSASQVPRIKALLSVKRIVHTPAWYLRAESLRAFLAFRYRLGIAVVVMASVFDTEGRYRGVCWLRLPSGVKGETALRMMGEVLMMSEFAEK